MGKREPGNTGSLSLDIFWGRRPLRHRCPEAHELPVLDRRRSGGADSNCFGAVAVVESIDDFRTEFFVEIKSAGHFHLKNDVPDLLPAGKTHQRKLLAVNRDQTVGNMNRASGWNRRVEVEHEFEEVGQ